MRVDWCVSSRGFVSRILTHFNLLLHETFGGGFSPTALLKLRRLARKVARGSVSLSVVRGVNRSIRSHLATLSARLARA